MTQKEKFNLLTIEDLKKIDETIDRVVGGLYGEITPQFWNYVLKELQKGE